MYKGHIIFKLGVDCEIAPDQLRTLTNFMHNYTSKYHRADIIHTNDIAFTTYDDTLHCTDDLRNMAEDLIVAAYKSVYDDKIITHGSAVIVLWDPDKKVGYRRSIDVTGSYENDLLDITRSFREITEDDTPEEKLDYLKSINGSHVFKGTLDEYKGYISEIEKDINKINIDNIGDISISNNNMINIIKVLNSRLEAVENSLNGLKEYLSK